MEILLGFWNLNLNLLINESWLRREPGCQALYFKGEMQMKEETFYLVREDVLPDAMRKTLEVKKLLDRKKQTQ